MTPAHVINAAAKAAGGRVRPSTVKQIADAAHRAARRRTMEIQIEDVLPGDVALYPGTGRAVEVVHLINHPGHVEVRWLDEQTTEHALDGWLVVVLPDPERAA